MKVILQCASRKREDAGYFRWKGERVKFVARPGSAPHDAGVLYARPDDAMPGGGGSWRDHLARYNQRARYNEGSTNPDSLLRAADLYQPPVFSRLAEAHGRTNFFILSAGWGLVRGDYLLPDYDTTFSHVPAADRWKRRTRTDTYADFNHLAEPGAVAPGESVFFCGGGAYLGLLRTLIERLPISVTAYRRVPDGAPTGGDLPAGGVRPGSIWFVDFPTRRRTNWHYDCAETLVSAPKTRR